MLQGYTKPLVQIPLFLLPSYFVLDDLHYDPEMLIFKRTLDLTHVSLLCAQSIAQPMFLSWLQPSLTILLFYSSIKYCLIEVPLPVLFESLYQRARSSNRLIDYITSQVSPVNSSAKNAFLWQVWPEEMVKDLSSDSPIKVRTGGKINISQLLLPLSHSHLGFNSHPLQAH